MRIWGAAVVLMCFAGGCESKAPPTRAPVAPPPVAVEQPAEPKPEPVAEPAAEANRPAPVDPTDKADPRNPGHFVGFSKDSEQFAYGAWSDGAGYFLFTIIEAKSGRRIADFLIDDAQSLARASAVVADFVGAPAPLPKGVRIETHTDGGIIRFLLHRPGGGWVMPPSRAFATRSPGLGDPVASVWGVSPSGSRAAIRVSLNAGDELGEAVTYHVVSLVDRPKEVPDVETAADGGRHVGGGTDGGAG